ncbi:hypothetical protein LRS10_08390 [Phenylobacterium sp. J426]|uniref:hypothetical protein n=1 Tax=Phenylobacterium sp. J426 TaxID=2898439 RepID=UPI002150B1D6|nr:hypothetical protein [Phenylobacterium sp. J426]MCR5874177.1 hypothetical protein [Phenylobacterium sp. J426]
MTLNPFRIYRRWRWLQSEAQAEAAYATRRHGEGAAEALRKKLADPALTRWGRKILREAIKQLSREGADGDSRRRRGELPNLLSRRKEKGGPKAA